MVSNLNPKSKTFNTSGIRKSELRNVSKKRHWFQTWLQKTVPSAQTGVIQQKLETPPSPRTLEFSPRVCNAFMLACECLCVCTGMRQWKFPSIVLSLHCVSLPVNPLLLLLVVMVVLMVLNAQEKLFYLPRDVFFCYSVCFFFVSLQVVPWVEK